MLAFRYTGKEYLLPEKWAECTGTQLIGIAGVIAARLPQTTALLEILRLLLGKGRVSFALVPDDLKERLLPHLEWVHKSNTLMEQLLPEIRGRYGPKSGLVNMRMAEFHACEMYYRMMLDNVPMTTEKLIAVLYRKGRLFYNKKKNSLGDVRRPYNSNIIEHESTAIARWPAAVKQAVLLFYDGCRQHIISSHQDVFNGGGDSIEEQFQGMFLMMRGLAADGKYGDFDKVEDMYLYTALNEVSALLREQREAKSKMEAR